MASSRFFPNRSNVQVADRFNPFVGIFDFPDPTELVQLIEALRGLALGQILTSADNDIITLSIGFLRF